MNGMAPLFAALCPGHANGYAKELSSDEDVSSLELKDGDAANANYIKAPGSAQPIFFGSVEQQLRTVLANVDVDNCDANGENAFFVADLSEIYRQHLRWLRALPRIVPFYAVKCNPDPHVLRLLAALGTGFDCASNGEIQSVLDLGVSPSRIIYANPCKAASFVRNAAANNVSLTTFDNVDELHKMKRFHPSCKLVVRILTDDSKSACQLGLKFGAPLDVVPRLLAKARELDLDVVGVSFHVGSGCYDPNSFADAVARARKAFEYGREAGYVFDLLDVGGGYDHDNFETIADVLRPAIDEHFPDALFAPGGSNVEGKPHGLRIIGEPGRYYVQKSFTLACNIIAKRSEEVVEPEEAGEEGSQLTPSMMLYQNDGVYGAFNNIMFDHQHPTPRVLTLDRHFVYRKDGSDPTHLPSSPQHALRQAPCSIWGPTCDSIDLITNKARLPQELQVGDWLVYEDMGAYTICAASTFNGLQRSEVRYTVGKGSYGDEEATEGGGQGLSRW
ncbi:ornithine decarboxylase [Jaminaea rosea]|uniref:ornithine decarboxylase n=1 Tax=Jaminaea rosea TaxID=1569628 RepID=A0A316UWE2_9BASI|nr:ornithine decarboxylase [Jaminaea rosea]PWN29620.1 ornithine decarboxylase [Jaminaea rosea]